MSSPLPVSSEGVPPPNDGEGAHRDNKLSANERRKLRKAEQNAARKAEKEQKKTTDGVQAVASGDVKECDASGQQNHEEDEELNPTKYYENRMKMLQEDGLEMYPHKWHVTMRIPKYMEEYEKLENGEHLESAEVSVAGRIMRLAGSGKSLRFYDLMGEGLKIQVMASASYHDESTGNYLKVHNLIRRGDIVGIRGFPGRSKRGELSIFPREMKLLSPCLHMLPRGLYSATLKDQEIRYRRRYLDLILNQEARDVFTIRGQIIKHIRNFLEDDGFLEVETPMMTLKSGGANAKPFTTHHNELDTDFFLRVAPELYLKMLIVGGMERVFEIGKNFRNEGIDLTHNPEFTSCEFYQSFADFYDLIETTERMLYSLATKLSKNHDAKFVLHIETHGDGHGEEAPQTKELEIDFTPPYQRISMVDEIERLSECKIPLPFESDESLEVMLGIMRKHKIEMPHPVTPAKLLDKLCGHFIEDQIVNPTFVIEHPQIMSPLAKWHRSSKEMTERGELFVAGKEICNFYTELNDPHKQKQCFIQQALAKKAGDEEGMDIDEEFCLALEHALPPTAGWGIGIDRLTMFLSDKMNIKEVILFPAMRPQPPPQGVALPQKLANTVTA